MNTLTCIYTPGIGMNTQQSLGGGGGIQCRRGRSLQLARKRLAWCCLARAVFRLVQLAQFLCIKKKE